MTHSLTTARDYSVRRATFPDTVLCVAVKRCHALATHLTCWRFDKKINGRKTEQLVKRPACEKHARFWAAKKGIEFPRVPA